MPRYARGFFFAWKGLITMTEDTKKPTRKTEPPEEEKKLPPANPYLLLLMYGIKNGLIEIPSEEEQEENKEYISSLIEAAEYLGLGEKKIPLILYLQTIVDSYGFDSEDGKVQEFVKGYTRGYIDRSNTPYKSIIGSNVMEEQILHYVDKARTEEKEG